MHFRNVISRKFNFARCRHAEVADLATQGVTGTGIQATRQAATIASNQLRNLGNLA
eukprot:SAG11_NODE_7408_length_1148_cov_1.265014_2_plen_55_part_01